MSAGCLKPWTGRPRCRSPGRFNATSGHRRWRQEAGRTCDGKPAASMESLFWRTNRVFTCCRVRSGPTPRKPVLRSAGKGDARPLSVMGAMTPAGKVYTLVRQESLNGCHTVEFLVHLRRVADRRLLVIWDGSPIHRRTEVQEFVADTQGRCAWNPAGRRPGSGSLGRGRLAPPQACRDAEPGVPGPGGVARAVPPGGWTPSSEASSGAVLLCPSRIDPRKNLTLLMQRSVSR